MKMYITIGLFIIIIGTLIWIACNSKQPTVVHKTALAEANSTSSGTPQTIKKLDPYKLYNEPSEFKLDGKQVQLVALAIEAFKNEGKIPVEKKNLDNYTLEWRQDSEVYMISFLVKRDPKQSYVGGETENGVDVTYVINKATQQIVAHVFYK